MAGGPIHPYSAIPVTADRVFPYVYDAGTFQEEGLGVEASVGADSTWRLHFEMQPTLPTGTGKLRLRARANATSNVAKVNPKWASLGNEEDEPGLNAEGVQTITWAAGDAHQRKEVLVTLDADTLVAGEIVIMDLVFETAAWTLAAISNWIPSIIWE